MLPETQVVTNYHLHHHTEVFFRPEVGYVLNKDGTTVYVKPGFDVTESGPLDRKWGLEAGIRCSSDLKSAGKHRNERNINTAHS